MHGPIELKQLDVALRQMSRGPYPPTGFLPVWEAELGNGDYFGLYWPLGRETREPIVCDMLHDQWALAPMFSSVGRFRAWLDVNHGERGEAQVDDSGFGPKLFEQAKQRIAGGAIQESIEYLRRACESVPDVCDYWFVLSSQLQRLGQTDQSIDAAIRAYRSAWHFGSPSDAVLRAVRKGQRHSTFSEDPIVRRSNDLTVNFGGTKQNRNYALLRECVDEYLDRGEALSALQVYQNYAFTMMATETTAFQSRYAFDVSAWQEEFSQLCLSHLGDARVTVT